MTSATPSKNHKKKSDQRLAANESMLEIAVNAAAAGHDLTGFEKVDAAVGLPDGYEARCRKCGQTAWVGEDGLMYSLLDTKRYPGLKLLPG